MVQGKQPENHQLVGWNLWLIGEEWLQHPQKKYTMLKQQQQQQQRQQLGYIPVP